MNTLDTIRYMGIKTKLLDNIIPEIQKVTPKNGIVLDIMAGSNAVSYALKEFFTVYTNDIQEYSYTISKAVIENQAETISKETAKKELSENIDKNLQDKLYNFFENTYSDTYFSKKQCEYIDAIRYSVSQIKNKYRQALYLFALMDAMCKVQSTPGHFAQFMPSDHKRIIPLQNMDILEEFWDKCNNYSALCFTDKNNKAFCMDYKELLKLNDIKSVDTVYLDSPYSQEQYSRFYHILETLVKYDNPKVDFKAKYRDDRFQSDFCYKNRVKKEFETIISFCSKNGKNLVISYSNKGLLAENELFALCKSYFKKAELKEIDYKHSTQGKGEQKLKEIIITCAK
ncbi:DNA adenine methylase [bacterium]|nr:DNA adenine methylase [bacterium]